MGYIFLHYKKCVINVISRIELCQVFTILSANNNKCSPDISDSKSHISASDDILETNYFNSLQKKSTMLCRISKKTVSARGGNKLVSPLEAKNTPSSKTRL